MSFKKYVFSMIICAVTIFVMMFGAFVPIKSYADTDIYQNEIERIQSLIDFHKKNNNLNLTFKIFKGQDTIFNGNLAYYVYICCAENYDFSDDIITLTGMNAYSYLIYCQGSYTLGGRESDSSQSRCIGFATEMVEEDDTSLLDNFLYNVLGIKELFSDTIDDVSNSPVGDFFSKLGNDFKDYVKTTLGITDEDTLSNVITEISTDNYISDVWNNVSESKKKGIQYTYSNLKNFIYNNVDTTQDSDGKYHYIVKNYNPVTNTYPDYFYNENYFYENILYKNDTNLDDTNNWLQKIYNAIIDLPNHVKSTVTTNVTNTYNYLFTPSDDFWNEWDLKFSNTLNDKFPVIKQVEDFTKNVGDIINSYSEEDFAVGSINDFFAFDNDTEPEVQTLSLEDDISNVETSYTGYVPKISIDLSKIKLMGYQLGDGKVIVMDFTWYLKYRPLIFTLIIVISYTWYIISLSKSLPRLIGNVADVFDYRQDVEVANSINEYNESEYYFSELAKNSKE